MKSEKGGRQMATIKEVAEAAQVSAATVSRVLNKDDSISVSPEVRMRIFQAAHALGYVSPRQKTVCSEEKAGDRSGRLENHPAGQTECEIIRSVLHRSDDDGSV